jgi:site-specific recombinase XerD
MGKATKRILITDASVARLAPAKIEAGYVVRDRDLRGFIVKVGMRRKTYRYEGEQRNGRQRKVISRKLGEHPHTKAGDARAAALAVIGQRARGESLTGASADITMSQAWVRYEVYLKRENRSSRTIDDYRQKFEKHLAQWHGTPLRKITRAEVLTWHGEVTKGAGAYAANGAARLGHAVFAYARDELEAPDMPGRNPFRGNWLHNEEEPRESGMGTRDISAWLDELVNLQSPVLREFHWLSLLSGLRRNDVATLRWADVSVRERAVTLRAPKGGKKRRFRAPLSRAMVRSLCRARIAGRAAVIGWRDSGFARGRATASRRRSHGRLAAMSPRTRMNDGEASVPRVDRHAYIKHYLAPLRRRAARSRGGSHCLQRI